MDILDRRRGGFVLVEVKSTLDVKDEHLPDVAVQFHVARRAGFKVRRAAIVHLNRECRHPNVSNLFVRENVTSLLRSKPKLVPKEAGSLLAAIVRPLPDVPTGRHCNTPSAVGGAVRRSPSPARWSCPSIATGRRKPS